MNLRGLQFLCLLCLGSLFALTGLKQFFIEPLASTGTNLVWFLIQVLPLLAVTPGVLRLKARSYLLAVLAAMLYFSHGVLEATSTDMRAYGLWEALEQRCSKRLYVETGVHMFFASSWSVMLGGEFRSAKIESLIDQGVAGDRY